MEKCSSNEITSNLNLADTKLLQRISSELLKHDETKCLYEKITAAAMLIIREELKTSEEKYRSLFDNLNEGFFLAEIIMDSSGKPADYQFLAVNMEIGRMVGLHPDEMIGKTWKQLFDFPTFHLEEMSKVALKGEALKLENYLPEFNLHYQLSMYSPKYGQFACHIQDISAKVIIEKELRAHQEKMLSAEKEKNEALKKAIDMKDEFLSLISHEFKTPLTVMISAIQAMELLCKNELSQRARGFLKTILQSANRQLKLVNNLLDITRINSGHIKVNIANTDIVHLSAIITESIKVYTDLKGITLNFVTSLNKKVIAIDEEKFERILLNLLSNAAKFTPRGKSITVKVGRKKRQGKAMIFIQVIDEGIGIPRDKQAIIFERFGQVDSSLTRQAEGTGIGLSLVKLFVELLNGEISVKSDIGEGSIFTVILPDRIADAQSNSNMQKDIMDDRLIRATTIEFSDVYF